MELDLGAVRAFVAVADDRHFGEAAVRLGMSQQAVSKRVAKLEADLGTAVLHRTPGGTVLTAAGETFLPHARAMLGLADQAVAAVRGRQHALRVDVMATRVGPVDLIRAFHSSTGVDVEVVTSFGLRAARTTLVDRQVDAAFARVIGELDDRIEHTPAYTDALHLLVSRRHRLAGRRRVRAAELAGLVSWMPGNLPGTEWADFYDELSAEFGVRIDVSGPNFGFDRLLDRLSGTTDLVSFAGEKTRVPWHPDIARIPVVDPAPAYAYSLLWNRGNHHPGLAALVGYVRDGFEPCGPEIWLPASDRPTFCR
ncbi:LysR family transcriptional regulator [Amycolatopsis suaedae]|uniref:LysR family transcriptional regulator n=1 Tax=Amycolatopsis suaedae TaxID=2510978 RepID=A0A4Q7IZR2_9PSEU|nr:LysR family transcriptional regulator [Amycolatopsis suaedae]RZQ59596.1 LysR family transcriptional regulator [Amycolatopsis suaedae]